MRKLKGLLALGGLAAIVMGMPILLVAVHNLGAPRFGWSWQGLWLAATTPDDGTLMLTMFKAVGWLGWAVLTGAVALELVARARRVSVPRMPGFGMAQLAVRHMVAAAAVLFVTAGGVGAASLSSAAAPAAAAPAQHAPEHATEPAVLHASNHAEAYTVKKGDTLSEIALEKTGSASNYPKIFRASRHTAQPGGRHLSNPDLILPGWKLTIPTSGTDHSKARPARKEHTKTDRGTSDQTPPAQAEHPTQVPAQTTPDVEATPMASASAPSAAASTTAEPEKVHSGENAEPPWLLSGLAGAGALLAGSLWLVLRRRRAAQFRHRRPGRGIAAPAPELAPVEQTVIHEGRPAGALVVFIDEVLRRLASHFVEAGRPLPSLVGVDATPDHLTVRFRAETDMPQAWRMVEPDNRRAWRIARDQGLDAVGPLVPDSPPPWPQLVTLGRDRGGWRLLNLETLGVLSITGDPLYAADLARYLVSELAVSPWSRDVEVDCLAICEELPGLAPARITYHDKPGVVADRVASAVATVERLSESGAANLESARAVMLGEDVWESRVLVTSIRDAEHLQVLTGLVGEHAGRTATSVLLVDEDTPPVGVEVEVSAQGRVRVPDLGLDLIANGLTEGEAKGCVALIAAGQDLSEVAIPVVDDPDTEDWAGFCNEAGSVRDDLTVPRDSDSAGSDTLLPHPDEVYLAATANTAEDLAVIAPRIPAEVRARVEAVDPTLDADLAEWWSDSCDRPRLQVLGPMRVRVGPAGRPTKAAARLGWYTEIVAYLSTKPGGVTTQDAADALKLTDERVRVDMRIVRAWLGADPATGANFLPDAKGHQRARERGVGLYLIEGLLCDADLFRRLRLRGEARGSEGLDDLRMALRLVNGKPFDDMRDKGGSWLARNRVDEYLLNGVVDVAHMVATIALQAGDTRQARAAAELAALAAPSEATPALDLAAVAAREGQPGRAAQIARGVVSWRDGGGEGPVDLPERADAILRAHRWLERAG